MLFGKRRQGAQSLPALPDGRVQAADRALVDAIYQGVLTRPATEREVQQGLASLRGGQPPSELIRSVVDRRLFFDRLGNAPAARVVHEERLMNDVSQSGEVEILLKQIVNAACPHRTLVDVGANGVYGSNAYDLLRHFGWRGVLVEANLSLIDRIKEDFAGLDCEVEACAVSDFEGEAKFCIGVSDEVSSLDEASATYWGPVAGRLDVSVRRLASILEQHSVPLDFDLLSLDIERHDVRVLNDLVTTSAYRPRWIIIEAPAGAFLQDLEAAGCSPEVQKTYKVVGSTLANFILRRTVDDAV